MIKNKCCLIAVIASFSIFFILGLYSNPIINFISDNKIVFGVISAVITGFVGYLLGTIKSFREEKQKVYGEILPPIIRMAYEPTKDDEKEFNKAMAKLWLYANRDVAKKVNKVCSILIDSSRGNKNDAIQQAIVEIRKDIHHKWPFSEINPEEVEHLYMKIGR